MNTLDQFEPKNNLSAIFEKIQEIPTKSNDGDYIYRGEPKRYQKVSSSLILRGGILWGSESGQLSQLSSKVQSTYNARVESVSLFPLTK